MIKYLILALMTIILSAPTIIFAKAPNESQYQSGYKHGVADGKKGKTSHHTRRSMIKDGSTVGVHCLAIEDSM